MVRWSHQCHHCPQRQCCHCQHCTDTDWGGCRCFLWCHFVPYKPIRDRMLVRNVCRLHPTMLALPPRHLLWLSMHDITHSRQPPGTLTHHDPPTSDNVECISRGLSGQANDPMGHPIESADGCLATCCADTTCKLCQVTSNVCGVVPTCTRLFRLAASCSDTPLYPVNVILAAAEPPVRSLTP